MEIDCSAGGGQLLRTSVGIAALTGTPIELTQIRAHRPNPGLKAQHAAAVGILADICNATVSPFAVGTDSLTFEPGPPQSGSYERAIETAGNVFLVFDTLLPLAHILEKPLVVTVHGGTETKWAPTSDYYRRIKLPLLRRHGLNAHVVLDRYGFYPVGGGSATLHLYPSSFQPIELPRPDSINSAHVYSLETDDLSQATVASRQAETARAGLTERDISLQDTRIRTISAPSAGSAVTIRGAGAHAIFGFTNVGEKGKPAESVASECLDALDDFHSNPSAVDPHTADQLLPFLAVAGGTLAISSLTDHIESLLTLLEALQFDIQVSDSADGLLISSDGRAL